MKEKLGFLYNGYKLQYFYWEVIIMYRKILLIVRLSNSSKMFFFMVIVCANAYFLLVWFYKMYNEMRSILIKKMKFVYLYLCLCGNERKYSLLKQEVLVEEEN